MEGALCHSWKDLKVYSLLTSIDALINIFIADRLDNLNDDYDNRYLRHWIDSV